MAVIGIGGVGSWAAEALARSAVGVITLIDIDHIAESNTNRQIHALGDAYGQAKVEAMAARIAAINPSCDVRPIDDFITVENVEAAGYDFAARLHRPGELQGRADRPGRAPSYRSIPAAPRVVDGPGENSRGDLAVIAGDPLLAKVRQRLRRDYGFPRESVRAAPGSRHGRLL